jgi:hypothetical protein
MLMDTFKLAGHSVRITWTTLAAKNPHNEQTLFRGEVSHQEEKGLWLWGSFFVEKAETLTVREVPRDKDAEDKLYFAPWSSIEVVEIIPEGTKAHEIHQLILSRRDNRPKEAGAHPGQK